MSVSQAFILISSLAYSLAHNIDVKTSAILYKGKQEGVLFGYSLTFNDGSVLSGSPQPSIFVGAPKGTEKGQNGDLYQCKIDEKDCKALSIDDRNAESYEVRDNQWLGASVYANKKGNIIVCAPRYHEKDDAKRAKVHHLIGKCVEITSEIGRTSIYPCTKIVSGFIPRARDTSDTCEAGFSVTLKKASNTKSKIVIGAIGAVRDSVFAGAVFEQETGKTYSRSRVEDFGSGMYLGYAVTTGNFYSKTSQVIAASIPRTQRTNRTFHFSGKVNIYSEDFQSRQQVIRPPDTTDKKHIYFGASLCAADVNGDGYDDLIVGAPFYSEKGDEGRAYVYLSSLDPSSNGRKLVLSSELNGSKEPGARFGWSVTKAGDLNDDFFEDFIVGAPQDKPDLDGDGIGNGAIYIYYGNSGGKFDQYQQKITAETVKHFFPDGFFRQFGYAVAGNFITNDNDYPDIAVGAWESGRVLLLRTRPVMKMDATMTLSTTNIPVDNFTSKCAGDSKKQCLNVTVCLTYSGKNVSGEQIIQYTFELDVEKPSSGKRAYLFVGGRKVYEKTARVTLPDKNQATCVDLNEVYIEDKAKLIDSLSRGKTDIIFKLKYKLISPPNCEKNTLCPMLDQTKEASVSEKAILVLNCSDNTCDSNLKVKMTIDMDVIVIGLTKVLTATIELSNHDEVAYNPEIIFTHDPSLQYERAINAPPRLQKREDTTGNKEISETFRLRGPLDKNKKVVFGVQFSTKNVKGDKRKLDIKVTAKTTSGQEKDESDNSASASVSVKREVGMEITGVSLPKLVYYPEKVPSLNIQNDNDFSAVNISNIGPIVKVTFQLTNTGPSNLKNVQLVISYPLKRSKEKEHDYIVYPINIEEKGEGTCKRDVLDPAKLNFTKNNNNSQSRRRRNVEILEPDGTDKGQFLCEVNELVSDSRFTVMFEFRLWFATLSKHYGNDIAVRLKADAVYVDSLDNSRTAESGTVDVNVDRPKQVGKSKSTPIWIIIVAVIAGVLLLALAIYALFKLGFFKRNRPPKNKSSEYTDDDDPPPQE